MIGEGAAAVVLKRLTDAERDGDRIYAVIRGIGSSSGNAATRQALERAYADAGVDPATVDYLEASAGGDPGQDRLEAAEPWPLSSPTTDRPPALLCRQQRQGRYRPQREPLSGLASFVRACLASTSEIIPACRGIETPCSEFTDDSPLFLPGSSRYWLRNRADGPRRAGVSSPQHRRLLQPCGPGGMGRGGSTGGRAVAAPLGESGEQLFAAAADTAGGACCRT